MKVAILGSCVTRDAFRTDPPSRIQLTGYLSRTSFGSIFADAPPELTTFPRRPAQNWEERMVQADVWKTGLEVLLDSEPDLIVVDLIDERNPLLVHGPSAVSWSAGLTRFGYRTALAGRYRKIGVTSEEFQARWLAGIRSFGAAIRCQVVLNRVYLSDRLADGSSAQLSPGHQAELQRMNLALPAMYEAFAREVPCHSIFYHSDQLRVDPKHRWGKAPYHYTREAYRHFSDALTALTS